MKKNSQTEPSDGVLTNRMDTEGTEFQELQAILLNKSRDRSKIRTRNIELLALRYQMEDYLESEEQDIKFPGEFLKQYLKTLAISQKKFADYINLSPSNLSKLINGERPVNYDLAIIFGKLFNNEPMLWIEIQIRNEFKKIIKEKHKKYNNYSLNDLIA
ncbi:MAG: HigA family addiction module antitoxin [Bacteroidales bacterium]|nr:HigA family addiction module antitoxin [Bacteroidales bacterium]